MTAMGTKALDFCQLMTRLQTVACCVFLLVAYGCGLFDGGLSCVCLCLLLVGVVVLMDFQIV